jgi:hypothetical protein
MGPLIKPFLSGLFQSSCIQLLVRLFAVRSCGLTVVPLCGGTIMNSSSCNGSVVTISRLWKHLKLLIDSNVNGSLGRTNAAGTILFCGLY